MTDVVAAIQRVTHIVGEISAATQSWGGGGEAITQTPGDPAKTPPWWKPRLPPTAKLQARQLVDVVAFFRLSTQDSALSPAACVCYWLRAGPRGHLRPDALLGLT